MSASACRAPQTIQAEQESLSSAALTKLLSKYRATGNAGRNTVGDGQNCGQTVGGSGGDQSLVDCAPISVSEGKGGDGC